MYWFSFTATDTPDWARKFLVYVFTDDIQEAYQKLDNANFADYRLTDRPSAYAHLDVVDLY